MTVLGLSRGVYPRDAACRGRQRLMWPVAGETDGQRRRREQAALALCDACPVLDACKTEAPEFMRGTGGVMGGIVWRPRADRSGRVYQPTPGFVRPAMIVCRDCGVTVVVARMGGVPTRCRSCQLQAGVDSRRKVRLNGRDLVPCPLCGRLMASPHGLDTHLALAHGQRGMTARTG